MKVAVIGATGLVGQKMLQVLAEQNLQIDEIIVAASDKSIGKKVTYKDKELTLISMDQAVEARPDIAIFFGRRRGLAKVCREIRSSRHIRHR